MLVIRDAFPALGGPFQATLPMEARRIYYPLDYQEPIRILETYFWKADDEPGPARHNRYLDFPGCAVYSPGSLPASPGYLEDLP